MCIRDRPKALKVQLIQEAETRSRQRPLAQTCRMKQGSGRYPKGMQQEPTSTNNAIDEEHESTGQFSSCLQEDPTSRKRAKKDAPLTSDEQVQQIEEEDQKLFWEIQVEETQVLLTGHEVGRFIRLGKTVRKKIQHLMEKIAEAPSRTWDCIKDSGKRVGPDEKSTYLFRRAVQEQGNMTAEEVVKCLRGWVNEKVDYEEETQIAARMNQLESIYLVEMPSGED